MGDNSETYSGGVMCNGVVCCGSGVMCSGGVTCGAVDDGGVMWVMVV